MRVIRGEKDSPPDLASGLEDLEGQFRYPLGQDHWFRISHGRDYSRFFRSMGTGACFVAMEGTKPVGVISAALRDLQLPDGTTACVAYIGDLKITNYSTKGWKLLQLARQLEAWARPTADSAYGVVMDGTRALPGSYSGRLGVPGFRQAGQIWVLRILASDQPTEFNPEIRTASLEQVSALFSRRCQGRFCGLGGTPRLRSRMEPVGLLGSFGEVCGILEDTREAKNLIADNGAEILSAHLSSFFYSNTRAGTVLILEALRLAKAAGFPALFTSCPEKLGPELVQALKYHGLEVVIAPATIFAFGPATEKFPDAEWMIHTSEI